MAALPVSRLLPWLPNGLTSTAFVIERSTWTGAFSPRFTKTTSRPSAANSPSSYATNSGSPWKGAVVSSSSRLPISFLLGARGSVAQPGLHPHRSPGSRLASMPRVVVAVGRIWWVRLPTAAARRRDHTAAVKCGGRQPGSYERHIWVRALDRVGAAAYTETLVDRA